ncbi:MAG: hypothetical protein KDD64_12490 [Bdellovibrionales bacterium]|nr:hypothetical protein [Bdellovibrionales bacterium]
MIFAAGILRALSLLFPFFGICFLIVGVSLIAQPLPAITSAILFLVLGSTCRLLSRVALAEARSRQIPFSY